MASHSGRPSPASHVGWPVLVEGKASRVTAHVCARRDVRRREARLLAGPVVAAARDDGAVKL